MIRIGLVGVGFMGWIHYLAYKHLTGAKLAAVCSRDKAKLAGDWRSIRGNFGPPGEQVDLSAVKKYERLEDLVADPDVVDVAAQHGAVPERRSLADLDVADQDRVLGDEGAFTDRRVLVSEGSDDGRHVASDDSA